MTRQNEWISLTVLTALLTSSVGTFVFLLNPEVGNWTAGRTDEIAFLVQALVLIFLVKGLVRYSRRRTIGDYFTGVRNVLAILVWVPLILLTLFCYRSVNIELFGDVDLVIWIIAKIYIIIIPFVCLMELLSFRQSAKAIFLKKANAERIYAPIIFPIVILFFTAALIQMLLLFPGARLEINEMLYHLKEASSVDFYSTGEILECNTAIECAKKNSYVLPVDFVFYFTASHILFTYILETALFKSYFFNRSKAIMIKDDSLSKAASYFAVFLGFVSALIFIGANPVGIGLFSGLIGAGLSITFKDLLHNFAAGIIISFDGSIKKNNYVTINSDVSGVLQEMNFRYSVLIDRDSVEYVVPNSMLISHTLENYSRTDPRVRLCVGFEVIASIAFRDISDAINQSELDLSPRVILSPGREPKLFYLGSTSGYHRFEYRFWIGDPDKGIGNVKSDVMKWIYDVLLDQHPKLDALPEQPIIFSFVQPDEAQPKT